MNYIEYQEIEDEINVVVEDITKDKYIDIIKADTLTSYIIKNRIFAIRPGPFPLNYKHKRINLVDAPIVKFLQTENANLHVRTRLYVTTSTQMIEETLYF